MKYTFTVNIIDKLDGLDKPYITAHLADSNGNPVKARAWLDKEFPENKEVVGDLLHELVDEMFPKKSAPEKPIIKTTRGKAK